jgi:hypothetical protein
MQLIPIKLVYNIATTALGSMIKLQMLSLARAEIVSEAKKFGNVWVMGILPMQCMFF